MWEYTNVFTADPSYRSNPVLAGHASSADRRIANAITKPTAVGSTLWSSLNRTGGAATYATGNSPLIPLSLITSTRYQTVTEQEAEQELDELLSEAEAKNQNVTTVGTEGRNRSISRKTNRR